MITDLCGRAGGLAAGGTRPALRLGLEQPGKLSPPIASPPSLRNARRDRPSQNRSSPPGPHKVSMIDPSACTEAAPASVPHLPGPRFEFRRVKQ